MDVILWLELATFILLLGLSVIFSSAETSLFSLSQLQLDEMRRNGNPRTDLIERMLSEPRRLIITILMGNELVNVAATVICAAVIIQVMGADNKFFNLIIMVPILLLIGEITPKTLAIRNNVAFACFESRFIEVFAYLITPVRWLVRIVSEYFITMIIGKERSRGNIITEDMVRTLASEAVGEGALDKHEAQLIDHIFDFGNKTLEDIMVPRSKLFNLPVEMSLSKMVDEALANGYSRVPIYQKDRDNIVGILHVRDLLQLSVDTECLSKEHACTKKLLRKPFFAPQTNLASDLLHSFRETSRSYAVIVDEYGGVTGLVTMDDLLDCIFGDAHEVLSDEYQTEIEHLGNGRYAVDALMGISEFNHRMDGFIPAEFSDTIGGFLLHNCGELPGAGMTITTDMFKFTIIEVKANRIDRVAFEKLELD